MVTWWVITEGGAAHQTFNAHKLLSVLDKQVLTSLGEHTQVHDALLPDQWHITEEKFPKVMYYSKESTWKI